MAVIPTKQLLDEYFDTIPEKSRIKFKGSVDRPELYAYEEEIGKQLVEMNAEELFELLKRFYSRKDGFSLKYQTYAVVATRFRDIFNFYIENYEVILNPWNTKALRTKAVLDRLAAENTAITWQQMERVISKFRNDYVEDRADYLECMMHLYYNGFRNAEEIVTLKEEMIDFEKKTVNFADRTVQLDDRAFELLVKIHGLTETFTKQNKRYELLSWNDSYFKMIVNPADSNKFKDKTLREVTIVLNHKLNLDVQVAYNIQATSRILYLLGVYDEMVKCFGKEKAKELVTSIKIRENNEMLLKFLNEHNVEFGNSITYAKRLFTIYVD